jgi:hypothetical protein
MSKPTMPEWKKERLEMTHLVWEHILDPIFTYAELVRGYDKDGIEFTPKERSGPHCSDRK